MDNPYTTQLQYAAHDKTTSHMEHIAKTENIPLDTLKKGIADGHIVIPCNVNHECTPVGIGKGLKKKVNANIGTSLVRANIKEELSKLKAAIKAGTDTIMDLSIGGDIDYIRRCILKECNIPVGTVPVYQAALKAKDVINMDINTFLSVFEKQAKDGIDFATVHAGVTLKAVPYLKNRLMKCVSRGGSLILKWMRHTQKENFLYTHFDDILEIAKEYDVTMSLGDGLRPGCIKDATDKAQLHELKILGTLADACRKKGVQVMIEGPGHVPLNDIKKNVVLQKKYCKGAPFYVLGPLPTDIAAGYDHIACSIGGALAGFYGADFLCYVTPKEHIGLPNITDVKEGVIVTKIAAHIADVATGNPQAVKREHLMAQARKNINWNEMVKYVIDPEKFVELRKKECALTPEMDKADHCSMCGEFCALKVYEE
ncbi:MAG: phosphomethylpyrimidine synthase ThiC [Candidatus Methanofastidiosia archaeon]|jgi:phosphomethylpyrimidine synthase